MKIYLNYYKRRIRKKDLLKKAGAGTKDVEAIDTKIDDLVAGFIDEIGGTSL